MPAIPIPAITAVIRFIGASALANTSSRATARSRESDAQVATCACPATSLLAQPWDAASAETFRSFFKSIDEIEVVAERDDQLPFADAEYVAVRAGWCLAPAGSASHTTSHGEWTPRRSQAFSRCTGGGDGYGLCAEWLRAASRSTSIHDNGPQIAARAASSSPTPPVRRLSAPLVLQAASAAGNDQDPTEPTPTRRGPVASLWLSEQYCTD
jgi:hypothetical protein